MMKKIIVTIACTLIALLAFGYKGYHRTNNGNGNGHPIGD